MACKFIECKQINGNVVGVNMQTAFKENNAVDILIETLEKMDHEIESAIDTLEVMSDSETLNDIKEGLQDIKEGRILSFEELLSKHGY